MPDPLLLLARCCRRFGSVKLRLSLVGVLLSAASVALTVGLVLREVGARTEEVALDLSLAQTRKLARLMGSRVVGLQLTMRAGADDLPVERIGDPAGLRDWLAGQSALASTMDSLFVADVRGSVLAWRDNHGIRTPQTQIGDRDYFKLTLRQGRPVVSEPMSGRLSEEPVILMTMPVRDGSGEIVAVLGGSLRLWTNGLMPEVTAGDPEDAGMMVITDARGRILSHADRRWLMRDAQETPELAEAAGRWVALGRPVEPSGFSLHAGDRIVSMAGVPDAEWMVFHSSAADRVLGGLRAGQQRALVIGTGVALVGGLVLLLATQWLLAPLHRLEQRARRMSDGDLPDDEGWPRAMGEIGQLSRVLRSTLHERSMAAAANRELLAKLSALMANAPLGIAFLRARRLELVSGAFDRLLGYGTGQLQGRPAAVLYPAAAEAEAVGQRIAASFAAGLVFDEEVLMVRHDGSQFWGRLLGAPVRWGDAESGTVWTLEDVSHARSQREALSWESTHDTLTELVNRREFERRLTERVEWPHAEPSCALFIDLDAFKTVNDTAGHAAGDRVLVDVAQRLQAQVRGTDTLARLGGDEFAVLLAGCGRHDAMRIAENMRAAVEQYRLRWGDGWLSVGASIGVVQLGSELPDLPSVMAAADAACYEAKRSGRNRVRLHDHGHRATSFDDAPL
ncbi:diguanylate cyclase [Aquincola sp. MAHUQ-54]|uniref:Diguanylate cyclase n=1 Tax=Aquincola agrisoli TaxID=3119538 RepID=A0AAW9QCM2_9BURK